MIKRIAWNTWYGEDALSSGSNSSDSDTCNSERAASPTRLSDSDPDDQDALESLSVLHAEQYFGEPTRDQVRGTEDASPRGSLSTKDSSLVNSNRPGRLARGGGCSTVPHLDERKPSTGTISATSRARRTRVTSQHKEMEKGADRESTLPPGIERRHGEMYRCHICAQVILLNTRDMLDHTQSRRHLRRLRREQGSTAEV